MLQRNKRLRVDNDYRNYEGSLEGLFSQNYDDWVEMALDEAIRLCDDNEDEGTPNCETENCGTKDCGDARSCVDNDMNKMQNCVRNELSEMTNCGRGNLTSNRELLR